MQVLVSQNGFLLSLPLSLRRIAESRMRSLRVLKGQTVLGRGSRCCDLYFVTEGRLRVAVYSTTGREISIRTLGAGEMFGELAAIDGQPRSASVIAESDARLFLMKRDDFIAYLESSPPSSLWLSRHLATQMRIMTERMFELALLNVQARLHCELLRLAQTAERSGNTARVEPAPTHAELATRIGTHREAVTREMRELSRGGAIRSRRKYLEILDIQALEKFADRAGADSPMIPL